MQILNIGLHDLPEETTSEDIVAIISWFATIHKFYIEESISEPTLIVKLKEPLPFEVIYQLSIRLTQDCIAVYDTETDSGELIGPKADKWGKFNKDFFVT